MICEYCAYRNGWECGDGWNRRENCLSFKLDWDALTEENKEIIQAVLKGLEENKSNDSDWY